MLLNEAARADEILKHDVLRVSIQSAQTIIQDQDPRACVEGTSQDLQVF